MRENGCVPAAENAAEPQEDLFDTAVAEGQEELLDPEAAEIPEELLALAAEEEGSIALPPSKVLRKKRWTGQSVLALFLALLPMIGFLLFSTAPLVISLVALFCDVTIDWRGISFDWNNFDGFRMIFVPGFGNSTAFAQDFSSIFWKSLGITFWLGSTQFVTLLIALGLSLLIATKCRGSKLFQIVFFVPHICSSVSVAFMWKWMFLGEPQGIINTIFGTEIRWLDTTSTIPWTIIIAVIWQAPAYGTVMFKAALANVDEAQYEAASLDGVNTWQRFWYITLPGIMPTIFYLLIAGIGAGLLLYDMAALIVTDPWTSTIGGRDHMALTLMRLVYYFNDNRGADSVALSAASVISWILFLLVAPVSVWLYSRREKRAEG